MCPHAERTPWVPFQGGTAVGETREEGGNCNLVVIWWEKIPEGKEGVNIILKYATYTLAENKKTPALKPSKILSERFICVEQSCFLFLFFSLSKYDKLLPHKLQHKIYHHNTALGNDSGGLGA